MECLERFLLQKDEGGIDALNSTFLTVGGQSSIVVRGRTSIPGRDHL